MAIVKVCGIETEYGITALPIGCANYDNPVSASSLLIRSYVMSCSKRVDWDFDGETPQVDARGFKVQHPTRYVELDSGLVNTVLPNGARYYVDHAHPEYSTPECSNPLDLVIYDKAGEMVLANSLKLANESLQITNESKSKQHGTNSLESIVVYKNNSDGKGNSYGCHENYLMDRKVPFPKIAREMVSHLVTRQIYTGAGKLGVEEHGVELDDPPFQLCARADFFEQVVGLETTVKRPIVNTRDEPHADPNKYRRLHIIVGDANLSEVATFLKIGTTAVVLAMIEDDFIDRDLVLADPVSALKQVSRDITLKQTIELSTGKSITPLSLQWELLEMSNKYAHQEGLKCLGNEDVGAQVLKYWQSVLQSLETNPLDLANQLDWVAKFQILEGYRQRHSLGWSDPKLHTIDFQYHDMRPSHSLFNKLPMLSLVSNDQIAKAVSQPPTDTRAYFRGKCLKKWGDSIVSANWDSMVFDLGSNQSQPLQRVTMAEPLKGTAEMTDTLIKDCCSPTELLERLSL
ncbi:MAG: proteasome accessory factor PafA2 [Actinobacteria bacterium]|nr:proteasome accessory factor PafA2 [Actinomycetota bacterium]MCL6105713.1 proteasome accessory factor PafA2 [Actinomycetota bacterium]